MSGQRIGRYEIIGELGEGGMAKVLLAHDPKFKRDVAIKVLPREVLFSTAFRERFQREAETIASLEHSAIVPVYDYGEEDGQPYLVMQQMRGGSLADRIAQGALSLADTAWIVEQIASALDKAHARGVIHRDLKPSNILFDEEGAPFLSDFGIVKVMEATAHLTSSGMIGTPGYMAPEMADAVDISPQIDVYALGVTLFQMLTGRMPYEASTPMGLMMAHVTKPVPDIRTVRSDMPDEVQEIIQWALAKDPAERYQSAGALAADLTRAANAPSHTAETVELQLEPAQAAAMPTVIAAHTPTPPPASTPRRRLPIGIGAAVVALILIGAIIAVVLVINGMHGTAAGENTLVPADIEISEGINPTDSIASETAPATPTDASANVAGNTPTASPLGYPVTANAQWTPIIREFDGVPMALVPAGCFDMGSADNDPNEQPVHQVCFEHPFWIDIYEFTNAQAAQFYSGDAERREMIGSCLDYSSGDNQPVVCVLEGSPLYAQDYCALRNVRLPTEAEWEYSARGPDGLIYPWGNEFIADNVVYLGNSNSSSEPVGSKPGGVSWVGAYDLAGNVEEFVSDFYSETYFAEVGEPAINPQGPSTAGEGASPFGLGNVVKGGAWNWDSLHMRASRRVNGGSSFVIGFRCARDWSPADESTDAPTPTTEPTQLGYPGSPVTANDQWTPVIKEFDGVPMALVPAGCFDMGSWDGEPDEQPVHQVCFEKPFWIDVYEVTNEQYGISYEQDGADQAENCTATSPDPDQPRVCAWIWEAREHCGSRGAKPKRPPTEAEWEYAARGPDALIYPWGNTFIATNVVYLQTSLGRPAPVGSKPGGVSWVGAFDMSGNVSEAVSDYYLEEYYAQLSNPVTNPQGPLDGDRLNTLFRGGAWAMDQYSLRAADRNSAAGRFTAGFRCASSWSPND